MSLASGFVTAIGALYGFITGIGPLYGFITAMGDMGALYAFMIGTAIVLSIAALGLFDSLLLTYRGT